jgi:hypothetical protein
MVGSAASSAKHVRSSTAFETTVMAPYADSRSRVVVTVIAWACVRTYRAIVKAIASLAVGCRGHASQAGDIASHTHHHVIVEIACIAIAFVCSKGAVVCCWRTHQTVRCSATVAGPTRVITG